MKKEEKIEQKEKITKFLEELSSEYGIIPKYAHNLKPFNNKVLYSGPFFDYNEMTAAIHSLIFSDWLVASVNTAHFEMAYSKVVNNKHSVMLNSGSSADLIMIAGLKKLLNWKDGDKVIISVVGFPTTLSSLTINNLTPVFVDIEMDSLNFDLDLVEKKLIEDDSIKAIYLSPVLGNPVDVDRLVSFKEKYNVELILDGCDSLGTKWDGKELNEYAIASTASFYSSHHISTIQGGMISSDNEDLITLCRSISSWGKSCFCVGKSNMLQNGMCGCRFKNWLPEHPDLIIDHRYLFTSEGYNLQPLEVQGSIGLEQLKKLDTIISSRKKNKQLIEDIFHKNIKGLQKVKVLDKSDVSWFGTPVITDSYELKQQLVTYLENNGIQTRNYFAGNILIHPAYSHLGNWQDYPNANQVLKRVFFVGCSPAYGPETIEYIDNVTSKFVFNEK